MKAYEIYTAADSSLVQEMLDWFRKNDRNGYKSIVATLAANRKLRTEFVQKKSLTEQYAWIHKTLKIPACEGVGEHFLQAYLLSAQQSLLGMFCDGMGIPHDGKGAVVGDIPKDLDSERLNTTVERLVDIFEPKMLTLYLRCFNLQKPGGWTVLTEKLDSDSRLHLG